MSASPRFTPQDVMDVLHERHEAQLGPRYLVAPTADLLTAILGFDPTRFPAIRDQYERGDYARYANVSLH